MTGINLPDVKLECLFGSQLVHAKFKSSHRLLLNSPKARSAPPSASIQPPNQTRVHSSGVPCSEGAGKKQQLLLAMLLEKQRREDTKYGKCVGLYSG